MLRLASLAVLAVAVSIMSLPCRAQPPGFGGYPLAHYSPPKGEAWTVQIELSCGEAVTGILRVGTVGIDSDLGHYGIKPEKIKTIRFSGENRDRIIMTTQGDRISGIVTLASGEELRGVVEIAIRGVETELGALTPDPSKLVAITFIGRPESAPEEPEATPPPADEHEPRPRMEYAARYVDSSQMEKTLNELAAEGWEIVRVTPYSWRELGDNTEMRTSIVIARRPAGAGK